MGLGTPKEWRNVQLAAIGRGKFTVDGRERVDTLENVVVK